MNSVSAGDLLQVLRVMTVGARFTRSISASAADHFISGFHRDDGVMTAQNAVVSVEQHIDYYEGLRSVTLSKLRSVVGVWKARLVESAIADAESFDLEVTEMLKASPAKRRKNLPPDDNKPKVSYASTKVYHRSAAVVAEVLLRADGHCETCKQPAPFLRASDGRPYLEVHHIVKLADDGEDTVANAIAVCPNCHRRHHFG